MTRKLWIAIVGETLALAALAPAPIAAARARKGASHQPAKQSRRCRRGSVRVEAGSRSGCLRVAAPAAETAQADLHGIDQALLAERLRPRREGAGRTIGSYLGGRRRGLAALERALGAAQRQLQTGASATDASVKRLHQRATESQPGPSGGGFKTTLSAAKPAAGQGETLGATAQDGKAKLQVSVKEDVTAKGCPDVSGTVTGKRTKSLALTLAVPLGAGTTLTVRDSETYGNPFTATTDSSGHLQTLKLGRVATSGKVAGDVRDSHGKALATIPEEVLRAITGPGEPLPTNLGFTQLIANPRVALQLSAALKSLLGAGASDPIKRAFAAAAATGGVWESYQLAKQYLLFEQDQYWLAGDCLAVIPKSTVTAPEAGQQVPIDVTIGGPPDIGMAPGRFTATASAGTVAPANGTYAGAGAYKNPDQETLSFSAPTTAGPSTVTVKAYSHQGQGSGTITFNVAPRSVQYQVTVNGTGTYDQTTTFDTQNSTETLHANDKFGLTATWTGVTLGSGALLGRAVPAQSESATGTVHDDGSETGSNTSGSYSCDAPISTDQGPYNTLTVSAPSAGAYPISLRAISDLTLASAGNCTSSGAFFNSPVASTDADNDFEAGMLGSLTVPAADVGAVSFTVPVDQPAFPSACSEPGGATTCQHTLAWSATATFTRTAAY